ncbi:hypothetical protein JB92DRAFT_2829120 [Gautieria morchelliformis]|nr:hypothetical protein JB92DRAFT_2829120 [Gautieria morchelliformis]
MHEETNIRRGMACTGEEEYTAVGISMRQSDELRRPPVGADDDGQRQEEKGAGEGNCGRNREWRGERIGGGKARLWREKGTGGKGMDAKSWQTGANECASFA